MFLTNLTPRQQGLPCFDDILCCSWRDVYIGRGLTSVQITYLNSVVMPDDAESSSEGEDEDDEDGESSEDSSDNVADVTE